LQLLKPKREQALACSLDEAVFPLRHRVLHRIAQQLSPALFAVTTRARTNWAGREHVQISLRFRDGLKTKSLSTPGRMCSLVPLVLFC
jgi:hypothetical protein